MKAERGKRKKRTISRDEEKQLKDLGKKYAEMRNSKGLGIQQLAGKADVGAGTVSNIEGGEVSTGIVSLERVAKALGTSLQRLLGPEPEADIFPGVMHTPEDILKHEEEVLGWEREGIIRRMILPFFSVIHQTNEVAIHIRERGCYNYSPTQAKFTDEQRRRFAEIIEERRDRFRLLLSSQEIASEAEVLTFARGEGCFRGLSSEQRREQLERVIDVVKSQSLHTEIRVIRLPLYIMIGLYGTDRVTIRGRGIYLQVLGEPIMERFLENFYELWAESMHGDEFVAFLEELRDSVPSK